MADAEIKKIKRSEFATFINVSPGTTASYARMGKGITSQAVAYNPTTTSETYIDEDSATTSIDSYSVNIATPQTCYAGEPVFSFVDGLRRSRAVGSECETDIVLVYIYDKQEDGAYAAEKCKAAVQIDDFGGDGGGSVVINYTINVNGDPIPGKATITNGTMTFTEDTASE